MIRLCARFGGGPPRTPGFAAARLLTGRKPAAPTLAFMACLLAAPAGALTAVRPALKHVGGVGCVLAGRRSHSTGARTPITAFRGGAGPKPAAPTMSLSRTWKDYVVLLEEKPIRTKMATAAVLSALGDFIAQTLDATVTSFSPRRMLVLVAVNIVYFAPGLHYWYKFFDFVVVKQLKLKVGTMKAVLAYLSLDMLVNAPVTLVGFFGVFTVINAISEVAIGVPFPSLGALAATVGAKMESSYASTLIANWQVWTVPQLFNFALVPPPLRVPFANVVAVLWSAILSTIVHK